MSTYRVMWTRENTDGGWWKDVDATDPGQAAFGIAVADFTTQLQAAPGPGVLAPVLISVTELGA